MVGIPDIPTRPAMDQCGTLYCINTMAFFVRQDMQGKTCKARQARQDNRQQQNFSNDSYFCYKRFWWTGTSADLQGFEFACASRGTRDLLTLLVVFGVRVCVRVPQNSCQNQRTKEPKNQRIQEPKNTIKTRKKLVTPPRKRHTTHS